jgi:hypothetical protein
VRSLDLTRYFRRYRDAARFIWNTSLVDLGDVELDFDDINRGLFRGIMTIRPNRNLAELEEPVVHYPELTVVANWPTALYVAREPGLNHWPEAPLTKKKTLLYAGLFDFDWTNGAYRDFEYVRCVDPRKTPGADGDLILVKANPVKILYRSL